jgi:hypothetical protein
MNSRDADGAGRGCIAQPRSSLSKRCDDRHVMVMNAVTSLGRPPTHSRPRAICCGVMASAVWAAISLERGTKAPPTSARLPASQPFSDNVSTPPMLRPHRLDAPRIQLRLYSHLPTSAGRADETPTGRRDGRVHRQAEGSWRNIALTTTVVAIHPGELTVAVEVGEGDGLGSVGHHAASNERAMCAVHLDMQGASERPAGYRRPRGRVLLALGLTSR